MLSINIILIFPYINGWRSIICKTIIAIELGIEYGPVGFLVVDFSSLDDHRSGASSNFLPFVASSLLTLLCSHEPFPSSQNSALLGAFPHVNGSAGAASWHFVDGHGSWESMSHKLVN